MYININCTDTVHCTNTVRVRRRVLSRLNPSNHPNCASAAIKARERVSLLTCANPYPKRIMHSTRLYSYFVRVASLEGRRRRGFRAHPLHSTREKSTSTSHGDFLGIIVIGQSLNSHSNAIIVLSHDQSHLISHTVLSSLILSYSHLNSHIPIPSLIFSSSHLLISSFIFSSPLTTSLLTQARPHDVVVKYGVHVHYEPRTSRDASNSRKQRAREISAQANHQCTEDRVSVSEL